MQFAFEWWCSSNVNSSRRRERAHVFVLPSSSLHRCQLIASLTWPLNVACSQRKSNCANEPLKASHFLLNMMLFNSLPRGSIVQPVFSEPIWDIINRRCRSHSGRVEISFYSFTVELRDLRCQLNKAGESTIKGFVLRIESELYLKEISGSLFKSWWLIAHIFSIWLVMSRRCFVDSSCREEKTWWSTWEWPTAMSGMSKKTSEPAL